MKANRRFRIPYVALAVSCFLAAIYGGLWRLGWALPHAGHVGDLHGPLMIGGCFGTLIGLERAMALDERWILSAPSLSALAAALLIGGVPVPVGGALLLAAAAVLTAASVCALMHESRLFTAVLAGGAACWGLGDAMWLLKDDVPSAAPWWLLFLILTIAAERLEKSRWSAMGKGAQKTFALGILLLIGGASFGLFNAAGAFMSGAGLLILAAWLAREDLSSRSLESAPHRRFLKGCMGAGYTWMAVAGLALLGMPPAAFPLGYDLVLHAILIGFVLSMAMGHSVMVVPAMTGATTPYHPAMYVGFAVLHLSVLDRVCADVFAWMPGRLASGPLTVFGLLLFAAALTRQIGIAARARPA